MTLASTSCAWPSRCGVRGERIEKAADVGPALGRAIAAPGPTVLEVQLDRSFKPA